MIPALSLRKNVLRVFNHALYVSLLVLHNMAAAHNSQPTERVKTICLEMIILSGDLHNGKWSCDSPETNLQCEN